MEIGIQYKTRRIQDLEREQLKLLEIIQLKETTIRTLQREIGDLRTEVEAQRLANEEIKETYRLATGMVRIPLEGTVK